MTRKIAVVLGAPRSMTSGVAKGLHLAGFNMGERLLPANPSNKWGHYEDTNLLALNDKMLHALGGSWFDPPPWPLLDTVLVDEASEYISARGDPPWGCKDPRMVLLWPIWEAAFERFPIEVIIVRVERAPEISALSLMERDGLTWDRARGVIDVYHDRLRRIRNG